MPRRGRTSGVNSWDARMARVGAWWRDQRGGSFVEITLVFPILTLLMVGASEFGRLAYYDLEISNAAHAGVQYGAQSHITASNTAAIQAAASADAPNLTSLTTMTTTVTQYCVCSSGTATSCASAATNCGGSRILESVQVNTSATVSTIFNYPGLPTSYALKGSAIMRVEQ